MRVTARGYPATRDEPSPLVDLVSPAARERLSPAALKAFFTMMERWHIRDEDARALLGGVTNGPFYEMKKRAAGRVPGDAATRNYYSGHGRSPTGPVDRLPTHVRPYPAGYG